MRKQVCILLCATLALPALAQTDFRHITYEEAVAAAKAENKMLFLDFYTDWCGPCKMMMNQVFPQKEVGDYFNAKYVCLKVNAEKEGVELAKKHTIKAYPTFIVLDANENVLGTKVGGNSDGASFIKEIDMLTDPEKKPERLKERYESGERTADLISAYATLKTQDLDNIRSREEYLTKWEEIKDFVLDYFKGLSDADRLKEENLFVYTSYTNSPTSETGKFMVANRDKFGEASKEVIAKKIDELYRMQIINYMNASQPYNETDYQELKKGLTELNKLEAYTTACKLIECHAQGDLNAYLDLCEKEIGNLPEDEYASFISNYAALFENGDDAVKQRATKYLRSLLAEMSFNNLYLATSQIGIMEGFMKRR